MVQAASIQTATFMVFISVILFMLFQPDKNTHHLCNDVDSTGNQRIEIYDNYDHQRRNISYRVYGPPNGFPIVYFHPLPGSKLFIHPKIEQITDSLSIRLITFDRPGIGNSNRSPNKSFESVAEDVLKLLNHLNIYKFSVLGHGVGSAFALATAMHDSNRVGSISLLAPVIFPSSLSNDDMSLSSSSVDELEQKFLDGIRPTTKLLYYFTYNYPSLLSFMKGPLSGMLTDINGTLKSLKKNVAESKVLVNDKNTKKSDDWNKIYHDAIAETFHEGTNSFYEELELISHQWSFSLSKNDRLKNMEKIEIWHGSYDNFASKEMSRFIFKALQSSLSSPSSTQNIVFHQKDSEGHYSLWANYADIILSQLIPKQN
eukprot:TRINITY_DN7323_c0_g1_i2.p1 TRINITY_DN7323_c0_g1~~TRINITY_DN7323_c0_g1_i2.p1  ORF type:complete len:372 (+),score=65.69 TRINITY_DN7323_c0_g1_i2:14-1129(+)